MMILYDRNFYIASLESSTSQKRMKWPVNWKQFILWVCQPKDGWSFCNYDGYDIVIMKMTIMMTKTVRLCLIQSAGVIKAALVEIKAVEMSFLGHWASAMHLPCTAMPPTGYQPCMIGGTICFFVFVFALLVGQHDFPLKIGKNHSNIFVVSPFVLWEFLLAWLYELGLKIGKINVEYFCIAFSFVGMLARRRKCVRPQSSHSH